MLLVPKDIVCLVLWLSLELDLGMIQLEALTWNFSGFVGTPKPVIIFPFFFPLHVTFFPLSFLVIVLKKNRD